MEKPVIAGLKPVGVELEAGESYAFCTCGRSKTQPFCDGSHQGTGFVSLKFSVEKSGKKMLCACKQTATPPYCDGTHRSLKAEEGQEA